jgi:hypothetical protein
MAGKLVKAIRRHGQRGMTTAEYAVGSVAVATGAGALITLFNQPWFQDVLKTLIEVLVKVIQQMISGQ